MKENSQRIKPNNFAYQKALFRKIFFHWNRHLVRLVCILKSKTCDETNELWQNIELLNHTTPACIHITSSNSKAKYFKPYTDGYTECRTTQTHIFVYSNTGISVCMLTESFELGMLGTKFYFRFWLCIVRIHRHIKPHAAHYIFRISIFYLEYSKSNQINVWDPFVLVRLIFALKTNRWWFLAYTVCV